jgi:hypothetical protein
MPTPHEYTINLPKASCTDFKTFKYCPETRKICLPDVLLLIGKQPRDYMAQYLRDGMLDDVVSMVQWQKNWQEIVDNARERKPVCSVCGVIPEKTLRCSGCLRYRIEVVYCSGKCRDEGWQQHKRVCLKKAPQSTRTELQFAVNAVMVIKQKLGA